MSYKSSYESGYQATAGFPILGILGLIFITLKLLGEITWSWWWVLAPFWLPWVVMIPLLLIGFLLFLFFKD